MGVFRISRIVSHLCKCFVTRASVSIPASVLYLWKCFEISRSVLYYWKSFVICGSVLYLWKCFVICGSVLYLWMCFVLVEVFCISGSVL